MRPESPDHIKLNDLMFTALDHAVESLSEFDAPLIPFSIAEDSHGEKVIQRYLAAERIDECEDLGKQKIQADKAGILRYAFAWEGLVALEGETWEAILVEAGDKVAETGMLLCQRYVRKGLLKKRVRVFGQPALIDKPVSRIR